MPMPEIISLAIVKSKSPIELVDSRNVRHRVKMTGFKNDFRRPRKWCVPQNHTSRSSHILPTVSLRTRRIRFHLIGYEASNTNFDPCRPKPFQVKAPPPFLVLRRKVQLKTISGHMAIDKRTVSGKARQFRFE
ncbi:hypothetical protein [Sporisorium scitamineum]|uniref:Uncharacterized protein n=1 Tax=Sporisorium scitamineum TaxID=49012 RepID=A0A0F7S2N4_9BASI|nr:hypothetical protein [Sporisorium scitamineum]